MLDEEWKEAEALAARCVDDPWVVSESVKYMLDDKQGATVAEVYVDDRRLQLPGHTEDTLDDARDIEAMRRLFPLLFKIAKYGQKLLDAVNS